MACSGIDPRDGGYATASAITVAMAIALTATALTALATAELKGARGGLTRLQAEYALAGDQQAAAVTVLETSKAVRLRWTEAGEAATVEVLAEPELAKVGYKAAAALDDSKLARLGVQDPAALRERLTAELADPEDRRPVAELDAAPLWRACAASLVSRWGAGGALAFAKADKPDGRRFSWRLAEVWRLRIARPDGWTDDRIVRFTGDPLRPAAVVRRRFSREGEADRQCETAFDGV